MSLLLRVLQAQRGCHALRLTRSYYLSKGTQESMKVVLGWRFSSRSFKLRTSRTERNVTLSTAAFGQWRKWTAYLVFRCNYISQRAIKAVLIIIPELIRSAGCVLDLTAGGELTAWAFGNTKINLLDPQKQKINVFIHGHSCFIQLVHTCSNTWITKCHIPICRTGLWPALLSYNWNSMICRLYKLI